MERLSSHGFFPPIKEWNWQILSIGVAISLLVLFFPPGQSAIYPACLLKSLTGLDCPGCGGLRALHEFLTGNLNHSIALNPLVLVIAIYAGSLCWPTARKQLARLEQNRAYNWGLIIFLIGFTLARNIKGVIHV